MFELKVIFLSLVCCAVTTGNSCMKHFVKGKWKSYGHCSENQEIFKGIVDEIRAKAKMENEVTTENGVTKENAVTQGLLSSAFDGTTANPLLGWNKSGNRSFKCFKDNPMKYQDAKAVCEKYGGRLAAEVLRDPDVVSYIASHCYHKKQNRIWIGFDDIAKEDEWIWSDGRAMNTNTTEWRRGEPNQLTLGNGMEQDCGSIWKVPNSKLLLNDEACKTRSTYICEV